MLAARIFINVFDEYPSLSQATVYKDFELEE